MIFQSLLRRWARRKEGKTNQTSMRQLVPPKISEINHICGFCGLLSLTSTITIQKWPPGAPPGASGGRGPPRKRPQDAPRAPEDGFKSRQERPKSRPGAISERPWRHQPCTQEPPGDLQEAMWDPSVLDFTTSGVWDPSELDFTSSGGRFWRAQALESSRGLRGALSNSFWR